MKPIKGFFWGVVITFWTYTALTCTFFGSFSHFELIGYSCTSRTLAFYLYLGCQWVLVFAFLFVTLGRSMLYIRRVFKATKHQKSSSQRRKTFFYIRFMMIAFAQTVPRFQGNLYYAYISTTDPNTTPDFMKTDKNLILATTVILPIFEFIGTTIVFAGNEHFWRWLRRQWMFCT